MKDFLDFLPEFLLWGSVLYFWGFALLMVLITAIAEYNQTWTWVTIPIVLFIFVTYNWTDFNVFGVGLLYSLIKTAVFARKTYRKSDVKDNLGELGEKYLIGLFYGRFPSLTGYYQI